ncbi:MAG: hypothetical protein CV087_02480 [Candidatus Brocadia sp. WS118]|nr:MAG: hypothetical protein CV087_02480 [Candidatus Brocadia sp. WS118]
MRSAGGSSPAKCRPQGIGATFFAENVKIYFVSAYNNSFLQVFVHENLLNPRHKVVQPSVYDGIQNSAQF